MKVFNLVAVLVTLTFAVAESTRIKILLQDHHNVASTMNFKKGCVDKVLKEVVTDNKLKELKKKRPEVKFFTSKNAKENIERLLKEQLPGTQKTAGEFLAALRRKNVLRTYSGVQCEMHFWA